MYKHILVALDGKPESEQALKQAIVLAKLTGASLSGISVIEKLPAYAASLGEVEEVKDEFEKFFNKVQNNSIRVAEMSGVKLHAVTKAGHAAQTITHYAEETGVDLIVVGTDRERGLGSTADKITENATCSVLVARFSLPSIRVKDAMQREVVFIRPSTSLAEIVELLNEKGIKSIPVLEQGKIVGIITGGDLMTRAGMKLRLSLQRALPIHVFSQYIQQLADEGKVARDIMTSPVVTIQEEDRVTKAAELMTSKNIKRIPVLNKQGELVGIISRLDLLALVAALSRGSSGLFPAATGTSARTASDIMFRDVPTVDPDASLNEVINKILSTPLRRVIVTDEQRHILGIIVDRDLVKSMPRGMTGKLRNVLAHLSHSPLGMLDLTGQASDVMISDVIAVQPETPLANVVQAMVDKKVKRIAVADEENRLVGMVNRESVLRALA